MSDGSTKGMHSTAESKDACSSKYTMHISYDYKFYYLKFQIATETHFKSIFGFGKGKYTFLNSQVWEK